MKTIFVTSFHPYISRNILLTKSFALLRDHPAVRIVLLVPEYKREYFEKNFGAHNVFIEGMPPSRSSKRSRAGLFFKRVGEQMHISSTNTVKRKYKFYHEHNVPYLIFSLVVGLLGRSFFFRRIVRFFDNHLSPKGYFDALFAHYKPSLVFSTDVYTENDMVLIRDAARHLIPSAAMIRSWDNPSKYMLRAIPDYLLAGSEVIESELVELHHIPRNRVRVVGYPHYDRYLYPPSKTRDEFLTQIGLNAERKLILFAPVGDDLIHHNDFDQYIVDLLKETGEQVLVRFPPASAVNIKDTMRTTNMVFDVPGVTFKKDNFNDREISREEDECLMNSLLYSDVVVTGPTSICLDAIFFDKPVIAADFYPSPRSFNDGIYEYSYYHFKKILQTGSGIRHVKSKEAFERALREYLARPELDRDERYTIREHWFSENREPTASKKLASALLSIVS